MLFCVKCFNVALWNPTVVLYRDFYAVRCRVKCVVVKETAPLMYEMTVKILCAVVSKCVEEYGMLETCIGELSSNMKNNEKEFHSIMYSVL
ncbi:hypothetical protein NPIL_222681 [Nephila pilipes]|uniref:Uncharacterized protein n=1 Tax=Nephila pilipes TaxID=299642 RepID=A0A8X6PGC0_NEPPI|nr:hypothetical protein NPIL_222681 [Nephila pilipes]